MPLSNLPARYTTSTFTPERASDILCRLSSGRALTSLCRDPGMPNYKTVMKWARRHPAFGADLALIRAQDGRRRSPGGSGKGPQYTDDLARGICAALAEGFTLAEICRSPAVPVGPLAVHNWVRRRPDFAALYKAATAPRPAAGGLHVGRGRPSPYSPQIAAEVIRRLIDGRPLSAITQDPDMPRLSTLRNWRRRHLDFHLALQDARRLQLEALLDTEYHLRNHPAPAHRRRALIAALIRDGVQPFARTPEQGLMGEAVTGFALEPGALEGAVALGSERAEPRRPPLVLRPSSRFASLNGDDELRQIGGDP